MFRVPAEYLEPEEVLAQFVQASPLTVGRTEEVPRYHCASLLHVMSSLPPEDERESDLLSDEPTIELVVRAQSGDRHAVEALLQRSIPQLKRWAHGRLPAAARNTLDTGDLVQETVLHVLRRLDT